ncbi:CoA-transferase family III protein [delta proteobacterium NaphS2]|nr:CoA-transferase family III protein [delta proteobacterium NaphS2]
MEKQAKADYALAPYRVLDLTDEKGFLCGKILGDQGADVIKLEKPMGDPGRRIGPFYRNIPDSEKSLYWFSYNNNKRSITLDIETSDGKELFKNIVKTADIIIESFSPGFMDQLGLGYLELSQLTEGKLVMTSITPFGQDGPYREYKASDIGIMAMSGCMKILGEPDRPPVRTSIPVSHMWAGSYAALGTLMALFHRQMTGEGQHVDVSMQASTAWAADTAPFYWEAEGTLANRVGNAIAGRSVHGAVMQAAYPCKDGYICWLIYGARAGAITNKEMVKWMDEKGMATDWLKEQDWDKFDPAKATQEDFDRIMGPVGEFLQTLTKAEFQEESVKRRIMGYPVSTTKDIMENPQLEARKIWQEVNHPELNDSITYPGSWVKMSKCSCDIRRRPPLIGEHNHEVYVKELGISENDLLMLKQRAII